jgi:hypothetical protein
MVIGGTELLFSCFMGMELKRVMAGKAFEWNRLSLY